LPAVDVFKAEVLERDFDAFGRLAKERVLAARARRVMLREVGREETTRDAGPRAVEVEGALRTPASTATYHLKLTCISSVHQSVTGVIN